MWLSWMLLAACGPVVIEDLGDLVPDLEAGTTVEVVPEDWCAWKVSATAPPVAYASDSTDGALEWYHQDGYVETSTGDADPDGGDFAIQLVESSGLTMDLYATIDGGLRLKASPEDSGVLLLTEEVVIGAPIGGGAAVLVGTEACQNRVCLRVDFDGTLVGSFALQLFSEPYQLELDGLSRVWTRADE